MGRRVFSMVMVLLLLAGCAAATSPATEMPLPAATATMTVLPVTLTPTAFPATATLDPTPTSLPTATTEPTTLAAQTYPLRRLTDGAAHEYHPKWSPDGQTLAFTQYADGLSSFWFMPAAGGTPTLFDLDLTGDFSFSWSPDGAQFVFDAYDSSDHLAIWTVALAEGEPQQLTDRGGGKAHPAWSPDGTTIAYMTQGDIWLQSLEGGAPRRFTADPADDWHPTWSPDGQTLLFTSDRSGNFDLWAKPLAGGDAYQVTNDAANDDRGAWSPDGAYIAFGSERSGNHDVWVQPVAGGAAQQITFDAAYDSHPAWSLDGTQIAFTSEREGTMDIWVADVSTAVWASSQPAMTDSAANPAGDTLLLIFGNRFIKTIYTTLRPTLEEAGYTVVVASRTQGPLPAKTGNLEVPVDLLLDDVQVADYAAVVFVCDNDITNGSARDATNRIVQEAVAQSKVLAAICSGPRVLAYADVVDGLTLTGEPSQTCRMLEQGGATCTGESVERDGLIITANDRRASYRFTQAILEAVQE